MKVSGMTRQVPGSFFFLWRIDKFNEENFLRFLDRSVEELESRLDKWFSDFILSVGLYYGYLLGYCIINVILQ